MYMPAQIKTDDFGGSVTIGDLLKIYGVCKHIVIVSQYEGDVYFGKLDNVPEALLSKPYSGLRIDGVTIYVQL